MGNKRAVNSWNGQNYLIILWNNNIHYLVGYAKMAAADAEKIEKVFFLKKFDKNLFL